MKKLLTFISIVIISMSSFAQTNWTADPYHSSVNFNISHSGISIVNGRFLEYSGSLTTDGEALENAETNFTVQVNSINTNVDQRDNHLKSTDFFNAEKYPTMSFKSTKILSTGKPDQYLLFGELTIKDVTKEVVFDVHYGGVVENEQGEKLGVKAITTINRLDYNIKFDPTGAGVGKEVEIVLHLQFAKK